MWDSRVEESVLEAADDAAVFSLMGVARGHVERDSLQLPFDYLPMQAFLVLFKSVTLTISHIRRDKRNAFTI